ncbi:MAG TPA: hypothetical protein VF535_13820, partial [Allosphingosinicella sp.]
MKISLLGGTALAALAGSASPAAAENVFIDTNQSVTVQRDKVDGTVFVRTSAGDEDVRIGQINTPYPTSGFATALDVRNTGPGNATVVVGPITGTGPNSGGLRGIYTEVTSGTANVTSTGILNGRGTAAVFLRSTTGAISFTGADVRTTGTGAAGIVLDSTSGALTVNSGAVSTVEGTGIDARTGGAVTVTSGTINAGGPNSVGIIAQSSNGGAVTVNADSTTAIRRGIFTSFAGGVTTINSNFATASGSSSPNAIIGQGSTVTLNSGTATLTGNGSNGTAIFVQSGAGGATVNSGIASTQGSG